MTADRTRVTVRSSVSASQGASKLNRDPALQAQFDASPDQGGVRHDGRDQSPASNLEHLSPEARIAALEQLVLGRLDDDKAQDVVHIDLKGKSAVADALIVASGRSHRHVGAMADHLLRALKDAGQGKARVEGLPACDWVLIDTGDVIIHLFRPEVRAFYNIEKIWAVDAPHRTPAQIAH